MIDYPARQHRARRVLIIVSIIVGIPYAAWLVGLIGSLLDR